MQISTVNKKKQNKIIIAGVDEVGRGPWAGPLIACAYIEVKSTENLKITDSKKLNQAQREEAYDELIKNGEYGLGIVEPSEIDSLGLGRANLLAFQRALENLKIKPDLVLIDGNYKINLDTTLQIPFKSIIKGDSLVKEISCASIVAKVTRDRLMDQFHLQYPHYHFDKHKGYGTSEHRKAIKKNGICQIHRLSFKPVQMILKPKARQLKLA